MQERNLDKLAELFRSEKQKLSFKHWDRFLQDSRDTFTMEHERELFDEYLGDELPEVPANDCANSDVAIFSVDKGEKSVS